MENVDQRSSHYSTAGLRTVLRKVFLPLRVIADLALHLMGTKIIYRSGGAIGDHVCMTAAVSALRRQTGCKVIVITSVAPLYRYNSNVHKTVDITKIPLAVRFLFTRLLGLIRGGNILQFAFEGSPLAFEKFMTGPGKGQHLISAHSRAFPIRVAPSDCKPEIRFSDAEKIEFAAQFPLPPGFAVIQSQGKTNYTPNKEWLPNRFQEVVSAFPDVPWVQTGLEGETALSGVTDLRGKTPSVRELAWIVSRARFVVCLEGVLNHLAAAFDTPAYVIFSGFHPTESARYTNTIPLARSPQVPCAPCGLLTPCPVPGRPCMSDITSRMAIDLIRSKLSAA